MVTSGASNFVTAEELQSRVFMPNGPNQSGNDVPIRAAGLYLTFGGFVAPLPASPRGITIRLGRVTAAGKTGCLEKQRERVRAVFSQPLSMLTRPSTPTMMPQRLRARGLSTNPSTFPYSANNYPSMPGS